MSPRPRGAKAGKPRNDGRQLLIFQALALIAAGVFIFWPALQGDWLWDDATLVAHNPALRSLAGLEHIWTATPDWALTSTLFWIEWHLWGNAPLGYHLCSLALHLASGFLVWRLFRRLGVRWAWLGGLLFVIHPLAVESVAWISETKNTLSLPLFLLSLDAYLDYDENGSKSGYLRSTLYFLAAMLAKTSVVMLPVVLLLYAWWKRGRISRRDLMASVPFFAIALVLGLVTIHAQGHRAPGADDGSTDDFLTRLPSAVLALFFYLGKFLIPYGLLPVYPRWTYELNSLFELFLVPMLALVPGGWWVWWKGWDRHALFGIGFFVVNLLPVLGLLPMVYLGISPVADHFVYLPMIGIVGLVVAGGGQIVAELFSSLRNLSFSIMAALSALLAWGSHEYAGVFVNHETLWTYTLARNPGAWPAHNNLGDVFLEQGHLPEAMEQYEATLKINPDFGGARDNLASTLLALGRIPEAIDQYRQVLRTYPHSASTHYDLGVALATAGQIPAAIDQYQQALQLRPDYAEARNNLGNALLKAGRVEEAIFECTRAVELNPTVGLAHENLADALQLAGRTAEAAREYEITEKLDPAIAEAHSNQGNILNGTSRLAEARAEYEQALRLNPNDAETHSNLGVIWARMGKIPEAKEQFEAALLINPNLTDTRKNLSILEDQQKTVPVKK